MSCLALGTHCAGTIASPTYGVAKAAHVYDVKVLNAQGSGGLFGIISGIEYVVNHEAASKKVIRYRALTCVPHVA